MDLAASFTRTATDQPVGLADLASNVAVVGVLILTAVALVLYPIWALNWVAQPQLAALVGHTQVIDVLDLIFSTPWDGTESGFDVILAVDGAPLSADPAIARAELREWVGARKPGDEVQITVRRQVDSRSAVNNPPAGYKCELAAGVDVFPTDAICTVAVRVDYFPLIAFFNWFVVPYLVGLGLFVWGGVVFWMRRRKMIARLFAVLCAAMALALAGLLDYFTTYNLIVVWMLVVPLAGGVAGVFALTFPFDLQLTRRWPLMRWMPLAVALVVAAVGEAAVLDTSDRRAYYRGLVLVIAFVGLGFLALMAVSLRRRMRTSSLMEHNQYGIVLIGSFLTVSPLLVTTIGLLSEWFLGAPPFYISIAAVMPFLPALSVCMGVAILWQRPFDTDRVISRGTTYTILAVALVVGYALLTTGLSLTLGAAFRADNPVLIALVVTAVAFALLPFRRRLETMIDSIYYRRRYTYQQHLEMFGRELAKVVNLDTVVNHIKQTVADALAPSHLYVFMLGPGTNHFIAHGNPRPESDVRFDADGGVVRVLNEHYKVLHLFSGQPLPPELITDSARLRVLGAEILAGLRNQGRVSGFIALGPRRSGEPYIFEDMRFLEELAEQAALGVERAQVITDLERRVAELNVLSRVSQAVNFTVEFGDLLELVYAQTSKVLDTSNFFIALHDPSAAELYYAFYLQNDERLLEREGERWRMGRGLLSEVVRTGQPIRTDDYLSECAKRDVRPREHGFRAWMGVPLNAGATTMGAMAVASTMPGFTYTDDQLKVFWAIADTAATAIDKSRLFTETERRARQLAALNQISTRLAQVLDVDELLTLIMDSAVDILQTESGSLLLVDEDTGGLEFRVATGKVGSLLVGTKLPRGTGVVGTVAERGESIIVNDVRHDPRWFAGVDRETDFRTEALMAVPLTVHNRVIGVLEVVNKRDGSIFTEEDVQLLTTFAAQASIAIENTRLYQQTNEALASRVEELKMLARIDRELNVGLEVNRIVELTLDWAMRISNANAGAVASVDRERGLQVLLHYGYGLEADDLLSVPLPVDRGIFGRVIRTGRAELVHKVNLDPDYMPISLNTKAQMAVPLRSGGEVVGVIILDSYSDSIFTEADLEFVVRVAEHASPALANARLYAFLKDANEAKSEFVSFVSHELKTPMTSIKGYTDLLLQGAVGEVSQTQAQFLSTIRSNIERMATLVSDLADITRIEAGQLRLEKSPIEVRAVIEDTLRGVQNLIEGKNQNLQVRLPDDLPLVQGDQARLVQVMTNLLSNAHKYTPEGGTITVNAEVSANIWDPDGPSTVMHLWVRDTGIGMSEDDLTSLFQKFFRSDQAKQVPGTGLGLSITKNLVELHGGAIWAESTLGVGSTFHFTLPLAEDKVSV